MTSKLWVRWVAIAVAVVIAGYGSCKLIKKLTRSDENKQLEARQDKARAAVGHGLDDVFEAQLDKDTKNVELAAKLVVDYKTLEDKYRAEDCGKGFEEAFEDALGPDVIGVSTFPLNNKDLKLRLDATISASGQDFVLPNSKKGYPGIVLEGDVAFAGETVHVKVQPGSDIKFEYTRYTFDTGNGISDTEVAAGILANTCKQAGYELLEKVTSWHRPAPPAPPDPLADCKRGFHCVENADALAESDPGKAEQLYAEACQHEDANACVRLAAIVVGTPAKTDHALARVMLDLACSQDVASACTGAAQVTMLPDEPGKAAGEYQRDEALPLALHGCDLRSRDGCELAATLVKNTPFAEGATLLVGGKPVASKRMGTLFALRWGQWTKFDRGQPTLWGTRRPSNPPTGAIVREFSAGELPGGIVPPPGVETVYALALDGGTGGLDSACERCNKSGKGDSIYAMRALDCVCSISPR
jgi:hypothetical protein